MVAVSIFSIVIGVALQQLDDSIQVSTYSTVQADLRRIGQDILSRIAQDLRSTQAQYVGADSASGQLELSRIASFNASTQAIALETDTLNNQVVIRYRSPSTLLTPDGRYQILEFYRGNTAYLAGSSAAGVKTELTRELAPGGFQIAAADASTPFAVSGASVTNPFSAGATSLALPGLLTAGSHFADEPVLLAVRVVLQRRTGRGATGETFAQVNMQTEVQLRASRNY